MHISIRRIDPDLPLPTRQHADDAGYDLVAREDATIAGVTIPRGEMVFAVLASANRDERQFDHADTLDITREPNRHLAFGGGIHRCLGSHLARLELRVALREWHARIPDYRIPPGVEVVFTPGVRSTTTFPLQLRRSA